MANSIVYLDRTGHAQELSLPAAGGQWTGANATLEAGAEPAVAGSPLAGYGCTSGHSGQVAYLDKQGDLWELSRPAGGQWTGMNLTTHATPAPPRPAAGSALAGIDWAPGGRHIAFFDSACNVWLLVTAPGIPWSARKLTFFPKGAAAPGSALSAYQWVSAPGQTPSYVMEQVVYLDTAGDVHELLFNPAVAPRGGRPAWTDTNLTLEAGAPRPAAGSPLSGYGWPAGSTKQVVFLDDAGAVWELSVTLGGNWSAANLTEQAGAPRAPAGSPLSGFAWAAGAAKQVVFLEDTGHVHELSWTPVLPGLGQPAWKDTDLTEQAGAPPAAAGSQLSGYDWPAANSKQVCYLDAEGHAWELSTTPGAPWSAAEASQLAAAPAAAGAQIAGYRTVTDLTTLYGLLRARLLSRHFALGRHFRADHLSFRNLLGTLHQAGKHAVYTDSARHVRELFLGADGTWTGGGDLTAATGAPAVADGSPLAGCQWPRGAEFVAYLDDARHVHLMGPGSDTGIQVDLDLHNAANPPAPPAAVRSPLVAYPWSGGDADQVAYLDDAGHVHEVSGPVGAGWSDADLTELAGAQPASWGSLAGYDWPARGVQARGVPGRCRPRA